MKLLQGKRAMHAATQRVLGERLGKPQSWVYNCESLNRRMDVAEFADWAAAYGVEACAAFERFIAAANAADQPAEPETRPAASDQVSGNEIAPVPPGHLH